jgi:hypothetical protein
MEVFAEGFDARLAAINVSFMQIDGRLMSIDSFLFNKTILSGRPAEWSRTPSPVRAIIARPKQQKQQRRQR